MKKLINTFAILFLFSAALFAQKGDYKNSPGYVDFGDLSKFESGDKVTEVLLEENLLKMAANFAKQDNPEAFDLLNGLKLVKVNSFEVNLKNQSEIEGKINRIDKDLLSKNWERIVKTRGADENANVYIKTDNNNKIYGLVVTTISKNQEASFINIVGNINLEDLGKLSHNLNIPSIDTASKKK